jgi:hypothetical protein
VGAAFHVVVQFDFVKIAMVMRPLPNPMHRRL